MGKLRDWLDGKNTCPDCGAVHYLMAFGIFNRPCPDCYDKSHSSSRIETDGHS